MKTYSVKAVSSGIGLIEVLITTVVIALGLLAVARFQLGILGESRDNKAMVEARNYCESGIEEFRTSMSRVTSVDGTDVYWAAAGGSPYEESYTGRHAEYARTIVVENLPLPDGTTTDDLTARQKRLTATCAWEDGEVVLQTVLALHDASNSALATNLGGSGGLAMSPSLTAGSSDDISETIPLDGGPYTPGQMVLINDDYYIVQPSGLSASKSEQCSAISPALTAFENGLRARRTDNDGYEGLEAVELFEVVASGGVEYCVPRVRFNGGVVIPIRGIVHSRINQKQGEDYLPVELFTLNVSESGTYCIFNPEPNATSAPYTCYVGGNCAHGPDGTDDSDFTQCPSTRPANILASVGEGGWRGKVGLLNVANEGYNVCFYEEANTQTDSTRDTAREYFSYNIGPDNSAGTTDDRHQGINRPYACHDLLIIEGVSNPNHVALRKACETEAQTVGGLKLASKTIRRNITTGSYANVYDPAVDVSNCTELPGTEYTISGSLVNQIGFPLVEISDGIFTRQCAVGEGSYSCTITTAASSVQISALQSGVRYPEPACTVSLDPLGSGCTITFPVNTDPLYRVAGFIHGTELATQMSASGGLASLEILDGLSALGCMVGDYLVADQKRSYSCTFPTSELTTTVTLYARPNTGFTVEFVGGVGDVDLAGYEGSDPRQVVGPDLLVAVAATYELKGTIRLDGNVPDELEPAVNPLGSTSCVLTRPNGGWKKNNKDGSYSCSIPGGAGSVTYSVSPKCSVAKGNNTSYRYVISAASQSSDTGSLTIDLGTVSGNRTENVGISLGNVACG